MARFPRAWLDELLSKTDLVSLVGEYVALNPKGGRYWGCCPFHNEKTPSFSVRKDRQMYYCFGCHAAGGAVQFVMEAEKLEFIDAVKFLAQRAGMELPDEVDDERIRAERAHNERLYAACKAAAVFYHRALLAEGGKAAQDYLAKRGVGGAIATRFGLGFAPEGWESLTRHLTGKGFTESELIDAGLAIRAREREGCYDAFRGRLIFPIIQTNGRVVGFGARTMKKDEQPKYLNTGDTPIYSKRSCLYALNMQKGKSNKSLIMAEGYMDVISLHAAGVDSAVASLGTAMTQQQARLIKRYAERVFLCYDGDAAGQNATLRGIDVLSSEGVDVRVMVIPDGLDPDDFVRQRGKDAFLALRESALTGNGYKLWSIAANHDLSGEDGREEFAKKACAFIGGLEPVERERYAPYVAKKAGYSLDAVKAQCGIAPKQEENSIGKNRNTRSKNRQKTAETADRTEQTLAVCMLASRKSAAHIAASMEEAGLTFTSEGLAAFADALMLEYLSSEEPDVAAIIAELDPVEAEAAAAAVMGAPMPESPETVAEDCIGKLRLERLRERIEALSAGISEERDAAKRAELLGEHAKLSRKLKDFM